MLLESSSIKKTDYVRLPHYIQTNIHVFLKIQTHKVVFRIIEFPSYMEKLVKFSERFLKSKVDATVIYLLFNELAID